MSNNKDPRRLPVYVDRVNGRLLADPQNGGPWFVINAGGGGGSAPPGSLTEPGILQLEDSVSSTSVTKAATPNSVRQAFDLAETANMAATGAAANATTALNNSQNALTTANSISATANQANTNASTALSTANAATVTANNAASSVNSKLDLAGGTITGELMIGSAGRLGFEGGVDDVFETYLAVQNPTADRTITLPNASGTVALLESANTWSSAQTFSSSISFASASCSGQLNLGTGGSIVFEGSTDDENEIYVYATNPTQDRSIYLPNADGTLALREDLATVATTGSYTDLANRPTLGTSAALNVAPAGNASAGQVVKGDDTRLATNISYTANTRSINSSTGTGATLPLVGSATDGLAPASGGGTAKYLRADGVWEVPPGAQGTDGDRGDITVSAGGTTWTIDNGVVTYAKMQAVSTGNRILGKAGATPGQVEEIPCTQAGRDLLAASDAATQRTILGLGALAQKDSLGFIASTGAIGVLAGQPIITTTGGVLTTGSFGSGAGTFCEGNDSRLSDTRNTTSALSVTDNGTGVAPGTTFNGSVARVISYNSVGAAASIHSHGNITNGGAIGSTANLPVITTTSGVLTTGTFGTTVNTFCQGNDARLSDTRLTTNALTFSSAGGGAAPGTTFNGSAARTISYDTIGAAASGHSHGSITNAGAIGSASGLPIITGAGGVLQTGAFGTTLGTFCQGNDSRLSDARSTPFSLTFSSGGNGDSAASAFNGSAARTISYNSIGAQAALGFTPVRQAGFTGTGANTVYIGWGTDNTLKLQIDATNFGSSWPMSITGNAASVTNGVYTSGDQTIGGVKTFSSSIRLGNGSASAPAYAFTDATNTGFYRNVGGEVNFTLGGTRRIMFGYGDYFFSDLASNNPGVILSNPGSITIGNSNQVTGWSFTQFLRNGTAIGSISQNGTTGVSYNTTSDYRLKENIASISGPVTQLKQIKPRTFNFIAEPGQTVAGFIAHELQEVAPYAVSGEKDAMEAIGQIKNPDGVVVRSETPFPAELEDGFTWVQTGQRPKYQGVDASRLVPLLTAALQEAVARLEHLEGLLQVAN